MELLKTAQCEKVKRSPDKDALGWRRIRLREKVCDSVVTLQTKRIDRKVSGCLETGSFFVPSPRFRSASIIYAPTYTFVPHPGIVKGVEMPRTP
jgi:hypothetical protein